MSFSLNLRMERLRKRRVLVLTVLTTFILSALFGLPAEAAVSQQSDKEPTAGDAVVEPFALSNCASGYACLWRDTNYQTSLSGAGYVRFADRIPYLYQWYYNGFPATPTYNADNSATSIYNNGNFQVACFYKGTAYSSSRYCLDIKSQRNNLATSLDPIGWNDTISSAKFGL